MSYRVGKTATQRSPEALASTFSRRPGFFPPFRGRGNRGNWSAILFAESPRDGSPVIYGQSSSSREAFRERVSPSPENAELSAALATRPWEKPRGDRSDRPGKLSRGDRGKVSRTRGSRVDRVKFKEGSRAVWLLDRRLPTADEKRPRDFKFFRILESEGSRLECVTLHLN